MKTSHDLFFSREGPINPLDTPVGRSELDISLARLSKRALSACLTILSFRIALHRRQTKRPNDKLPATKRERQIITNTRPRPAANTFSRHRYLMQLEHPLRLIVASARATGLGQRVAGVHEVGKRRELDDAVGEVLCPADQACGARVELCWQAGHDCEAGRVLAEQGAEGVQELEEVMGMPG